MKVKDLISLLQSIDQELPVQVWNCSKDCESDAVRVSLCSDEAGAPVVHVGTTVFGIEIEPI